MRARTITIAIGVAAAGVMALGAQSAAALPARCTVSSPCSYGTRLTITVDRGTLFHGYVISHVRQCEIGRQVVLFRQDRGADTKLGKDRSGPSHRAGFWGVREGLTQDGTRVYAKAERRVRDRVVCLADRSPTYTWG